MGDTTRTARALLSEMHPCADRDNAHSTPGGTWHMSSNRMGSMLDSVERQARADLLDRLAAGVRAIRPYAYDSLAPNTGPNLIEPAAVLALIEEARHQHVWVTTFGSGPDWQEHCANCPATRAALEREP